MSAERDRRLIDIVEAVLREAPETRARLLADAAEGDDALLRDAWELLRATNGDPHFLTSWAAGTAAALVETSVSLAPGDGLGPYHIERRLASGGMGQVYEATDVRLRRKVAVKVLSPLSTDRVTRTRALEEARMISRLDHPRICAIYDVGIDGGMSYIVMQLLDGPTLRQKLEKKRPALGVALDWAIDITEALAHAHAVGLIHRDLKPENVVITRAGATLVDFGIATLLEGEPARPQRAGTLPYMSPEQLRGEAVTTGSDLFALGAILFELFHGRPAFAAADPEAIARSILAGDRAPRQTSVKLPPPIEDLLDKCLNPSPAERWQSAADANTLLRWLRHGSLALHPQRRRTLSSKWPLAAVALTMFVAAILLWFATRPRAARSPITFTVDAEAGARLVYPAQVAVAPDGESMAYVAVKQGSTHIYVRELRQPHAHEIGGTENGQHPFWSPDGSALGFFADKKLKRVAASGGPAVIVCDAPMGLAGAWGSRGVILFAGGRGPILKVDAAGGTPQPASVLNAHDEDESNRWPIFLPDGNRFLYNAQSNRHEGKLYAASVRDGRGTYVLDTPSQAIFSQGLLYYRRGANLIAQPFDDISLRAFGDTISIAERMGPQSFSASSNGVLAYWSGARSEPSVLTWVDRTGKELETLGQPAHYAGLSLSRRGDTVVATVCESIDCEDPTTTNFVRAYNLRMVSRDGGEVRVTNDQAVAATPVWSPGDKQIVFGSTRRGHMDLYRRRIGSAVDEALLPPGPDRGATSWSANGRFLAYTELGSDTGFDIWILDLRTGDRFVFCGTNATETGAAFSPDGKWIAYSADDSGTTQVYVAPFGGRPANALPSGRVRISRESGMLPSWRADGSELYYHDGLRLMAVRVRISAGKLVAEAPRLLFRLRRLSQMGAAYAPSPDGNRFLVLGSSPSLDTPITVRTP